MRLALVLAGLGLLAACAEAASPYDDPNVTWRSDDFAGVTLVFDGAGRFSGQAPCNRYGGGLAADWPDFAAEAVFSTKMACPALAEEAAYFAALEAVTGAALDGEALVLSGPDGVLMRFSRD